MLRVNGFNIAIQLQDVDFLNRVVSLYNIRQFLDCFHDMQERELYSYKWLASMWSSNDHEINFYKIYFQTEFPLEDIVDFFETLK